MTAAIRICEVGDWDIDVDGLWTPGAFLTVTHGVSFLAFIRSDAACDVTKLFRSLPVQIAARAKWRVCFRHSARSSGIAAPHIVKEHVREHLEAGRPLSDISRFDATTTKVVLTLTAGICSRITHAFDNLTVCRVSTLPHSNHFVYAFFVASRIQTMDRGEPGADTTIEGFPTELVCEFLRFVADGYGGFDIAVSYALRPLKLTNRRRW